MNGLMAPIVFQIRNHNFSTQCPVCIILLVDALTDLAILGLFKWKG